VVGGVVVAVVVGVDGGPAGVARLDATDPVVVVPGGVGTFTAGAGVVGMVGGVADMATTPFGPEADGAGPGR
jgi:hypothetical protein